LISEVETERKNIEEEKEFNKDYPQLEE